MTPECGVIATVSPTPVATATLTRTILPTQTITATLTGQPTATPTITMTTAPTQAGTPIVIEENESYASPNPATIYVNFNYKMDKPAEKVRIEIFNFLGRNVGYVEERNIAAGFIQIRLNLHKFAPGVYFYILQINHADTTVIRYKPAKFMVVKE